MPVPSDILRERLAGAFPKAEILLTDTHGDQDHYHLTIYAPDLAGQSRIQQHKTIYRALGSMVGGTLHALTIDVRDTSFEQNGGSHD